MPITQSISLIMNSPCHQRIANKKAMNRAISQSGKHFKMTYLFYGIMLLATENGFSLIALKVSSVLPIYPFPGPLTVTNHSITVSFHIFKMSYRCDNRAHRLCTPRSHQWCAFNYHLCVFMAWNFFFSKHWIIFHCLALSQFIPLPTEGMQAVLRFGNYE